MHWTRLALGAAVLALAGPTFAQNLFTNGDFSADVAPTAQTATGWTAGGFGYAAGNGGVRNDSFSLPGSGNYYWINDAPGPQVSISQLISFTPGNALKLSGNYASLAIGAGTGSFQINVFDSSNDTLLAQQSLDPTQLGNWSTFNFTTPVLSATNLRVSFVAQVGTDDDYAIDNLTALAVDPAAAPEPTTALLALLGIPALFVRRRK